MTQKVLTTGGGIVPEGLMQLAGPEAAEGVNIITFFAPWFPETDEGSRRRPSGSSTNT